VRRRLKVEIQRVPDIEGENFMSLRDHFVGYAGEVADGVADIFQARSGRYLAGFTDGCHEYLGLALLSGHARDKF
jgi:hypothetical protein